MRKRNQKAKKRIEVQIDGVTVRGIVSSNYQRLKIFIVGSIGGEPVPIPAGEIDLSTDIPTYYSAGYSIDLLDKPAMHPNLAGMDLWFDFLEKVALQLPEPYRSRLEQTRAALISLLLKEGGLK